MKYNTAIAAALAGTATASWSDWSSDPAKATTSSTTTWEDWSTYSTPAASSKYDPSTWADWSSTPAASSKYDPSTWADWSSSYTPAASSKYDPSTWADWSAAATVTVTKSKPSATTTVYKSTVFVGAGCKATVSATACYDPSTWADWSSYSTPAAASSTSKDPWADWSSSYSTPAAATTTSSWSAGKTVTVTNTEYGTTATVYSSTVYVGPGECTTTVYPSTCGGSAAYTTPAAASKPAHGGWGSPSYPAAAHTTTPVAGDGWGSDGNGIGVPVGSLKPGIPGSIIGSNAQVFTWLGDHDPKPTYSAVPTYAGWGDWSPGSNNGGSGSNGTGPSPGSDASNVTKPFKPLGESGCNSASDRSKWCGGYSIDTDYYNEGPSTGKTCSYSWEITNTTQNYDGIDRLALAINGQVPGPLIECNWGDTVTISVKNSMKDNATTIHWHGILQKGTNDQDGVPGVTECAIAPGQSRTYSWVASQYGTGWYHSHLLSQYGDGIRGPVVIHGPATANYDVDAGTVMIDDLFGTPQAPDTVAATNSRIAHFGPGGTWNYVLNGANTFPDLSKGKHALWKVKSGQKYLFRLINSASQNMWSVHFDSHEMQVIATDYVPITPYTTEWLNIGIGQRYDVVVEMNQKTAGYFLRAVTQTGCPSGCANDGLGNANGIFLYEGADATLPTSTPGNVTAADFAICADEPISKISPHLVKSAGSSSAFQASASTIPGGLVTGVQTPDDGVVFRWFLNNGAIDIDYSQPTLQTLASGSSANATAISNPIVLSSKNEWVYFVIQNQFFAGHPMHLHGHDFSLLGQGTTAWNPSLVSTLNFDNPVRRDTAMLAGSPGPQFPPGYTVIGFQTDNPGAWLMHCHIIWHVDGGLALQWIERPDDIPTSKYCGSDFQSECSSLTSYQSSNPAHVKSSGESGLKARNYFDRLVEGHANDVVRRSNSPGRRYIDSHLKRGLGDGYKPRHGARR